MPLTGCGRAVPKVSRETTWDIGIKGELPPYLYRVWITKKKTKTMMGFSEQHIRDQLDPIKPLKIQKIKEKKEKETKIERLGPKDAPVGRPADYEPAFKILRAWVDSQGGPPEDVRKAIREHWIDYRKVSKK